MKCIDANINVKCDKKAEEFLNLSSGDSNKKDNIQTFFSIEQESNCEIAKVKIDVSREETWDTEGLIAEEPITIDVSFDSMPEKMTCMYLYSEWWTRPGFVEKSTDIPAKTQVLFCKHKDFYSCFLPMVGNTYKTYINPSDSCNQLRFVMDAGISGVRNVNEIIYIYSQAKTLNAAIENIFNLLHTKWDIKLRKDRKYPEIFKYIGWCSWDAFYKNISENQILSKTNEIKEKNIPIRWMIFDDGWLQDQNDMLNSLEPDKEKFPNGFNQLILDIKSKSNVNWIGVWHAFGGYWAGINPCSELAKEKSDSLYKTVNGRVVPSPYTGSKFYRTWYEMLKAGQVDFVKVDGQSAMPIYFKNDISYIEGARGLSEQLEEGAEIFNKNVINCMGMAMENVLSRKSTGISRNSDDFVPLKENGFKEHILQNAYNSLYHNELYYLDWDMFWTTHVDAFKHGLIRAISGGPIYISDKVNESNPAIIKKLCYYDGKIPLLNRSAKPCADVVFTDVTQDGLLKINNVGDIIDGKKAGVLAVFNLTDTKQENSIHIFDIPEMQEYATCYVYDYRVDTVIELNNNESINVSLAAGEYSYYIFLPKDECTPIGLLDKYVGFKAVIDCQKTTDGMHMFTLEEIGRFGFITKNKIKAIRLNGQDISARLIPKGTYYCLDLSESPEEGKIEIELEKK